MAAVGGIIHEAGDDVSPKIDGGFPDATETQMTSLDRALARREVERAERIDAGKAALSEGSIDRASSETQ